VTAYRTEHGPAPGVTTAGKGTSFSSTFRPEPTPSKRKPRAFKKSESRDLILPLATKIGLGDIVLAVGSISDTVTVEATPGRSRFRRNRASAPTS